MDYGRAEWFRKDLFEWISHVAISIDDKTAQLSASIKSYQLLIEAGIPREMPIKRF